MPQRYTRRYCDANRDYIRDFSRPRPRTADEWTSILSLATRWDFAGVRALAIAHFRTHADALGLTPVDRILLARAYDIPRTGDGGWLLAAHTALCTRAEPLSLAEAARLGVETAARVAQLRELLRGPNPSARFGGYCAPTRSTAARETATRAQRSQGAANTVPRRSVIPQARSSTSRSTTAIPGPARLVAEAFDLGR